MSEAIIDTDHLLKCIRNEPGACISKLSLAVDVTKSLSTLNERLTSV